MAFEGFDLLYVEPYYSYYVDIINDIEINFQRIERFVWDSIGPVIDGIYITLGNHDDKINSLWGSVFTTIPKQISDIWKAINAITMPDITGIEQRLTDAENDIDKLEKYIYNWLAKVVVSNTKDISSIWQYIADIIEPSLDNIDQDIITLVDEVYTNIPTYLDDLEIELKLYSDNSLADIHSYIDGEINRLSEALEGTSAQLNAEIIAQVTGLQTQIDQLSGSISKQIDSLHNQITNEYQSAIDAVKLSLDTRYNQLEETLNSQNTALQQQISSLDNEISSELSTIQQTINDNLLQTESEIESLQSDFSRYVDNPLALLLGIITDKNGIYTTYQQLWQRFVVKLLG